MMSDIGDQIEQGSYGPEWESYQPCQKCKQLQREIGQLLAELMKADAHPLVESQDGVTGIDRCHRVINKQQAEIEQLRQRLEARCDHCAVVEDAYDRGIKAGRAESN